MTNQVIRVLSKGRVLWFLALAILAANQFVVARAVGGWASETAANYVYVLVRILVFFGLALLLTRWTGFRRFRALSAVGLLVAVEHIGFRLILVLQDYRANPAEYAEGLTGPIFGLMMSYIIGLPVVLLIAFLGTSLGAQGKVQAEG